MSVYISQINFSSKKLQKEKYRKAFMLSYFYYNKRKHQQASLQAQIIFATLIDWDSFKSSRALTDIISSIQWINVANHTKSIIIDSGVGNIKTVSFFLLSLPFSTTKQVRDW